LISDQKITSEKKSRIYGTKPERHDVITKFRATQHCENCALINKQSK